MCTLTAVHVCELRQAIFFYMHSDVPFHLYFAVESRGCSLAVEMKRLKSRN